MKIFVHHTSPPLLAIPPIYYKLLFKSRLRKKHKDLDIWPDTLNAIGALKSILITKSIKSFYILYLQKI